MSGVSLWELPWEPFHEGRGRLRVIKTMAGGTLEFCEQGGLYFLLRRAARNRYEEAGRGLYRQAYELWLNVGGEP